MRGGDSRPSQFARRMLTLVILLVLVPGTQADECHGLVDITVGRAHTDIITAVYHTDQDAAALRDDVDAIYGDGNGEVTASEWRAFEDALNDFAGNDEPRCMEEMNLVERRGRAPDHFVDRDMDVEGQPATAPVDSGDVLIFIVSYRYEWTTDLDGDQVEYMFDLQEPDDPGDTLECMGAIESHDHGFPFDWCGDKTSFPSDDNRYVLRADTGTFIAASIQPAAAQSLHDDNRIEGESQDDQRTLTREPVIATWTPAAADTATAPADDTAWTAYGFGLTALLAALFLWTKQWFRYHAIRYLGLLLAGFTRIKEDELLEHPRRDALVRLIRANPGIHLTELKRQTGYGTGSLVHHLQLLERGGHLRRVRDGPVVRFLHTEHHRNPDPYLSDVQRRILDAIQANPGASQQELANQLGLPRGTVGYNVRRLKDQGLINVQREGRHQRHEPPKRGFSITDRDR